MSEGAPDSNPQEEILSRHSASFAQLVRVMLEEAREKDRKEVAELLDNRLAKLNAHIENEDIDRGKLMRTLAELSGELSLITQELKAYRQDNIATRAAVEALAKRIDKHAERIQTLEKKVG